VLFGGSDSQSAVKAIADSQAEFAGVAALGQRLRDVFSLRYEVGDRVGPDVDKPLQRGRLESASQDSKGTSAQVATNSPSSTDQVTR
jgi:hypothetical protein